MPRKLRTDKRVAMTLEELFIFDVCTESQLAGYYGSLELAEERYSYLVGSGKIRGPRLWTEVVANAGLRVVEFGGPREHIR